MLAPNGEAIFILPNASLLSSQAAPARKALAQMGLYIHTLVTLQPGSFPQTSVESNIVFIGRDQVTDVFVARLAPGQDVAALLSNLRGRKPGAAPELGKLVTLRSIEFGTRSWIVPESRPPGN